MHFLMKMLFGVRLSMHVYICDERLVYRYELWMTGVAYTIDPVYESEVRDYLGMLLFTLEKYWWILLTILQRQITEKR